ncbi:MAG: glycosyltransferase [bacterium]|nr:glycosyltransferase [bacterium]
MDKPFISVVIPTRRERQVLDICLNSLLKQNYPKNLYEIILVSNKAIIHPEKRIKSVIVQKNKNHAQARNAGVNFAKGELIAFCDDDCILPTKWLSIAAVCFNRGYDLVGGPVIPPRKTTFRYRLAGYLAGSRFVVGFAAARHQPIFKEQEAREFDLILANTIMRKSIFEKIGGFDRDQVPCEENFLYHKLKQHGYKLLYSPKIASIHQAKPIFFPWAKKIFYYSTGRGQMVIRAPESFHIHYLIPSLFVLSLVSLVMFSFFSPLAFFALLTIIFFYALTSLTNSLYVFMKFEKNPMILLASPIATFIVHFTYGLGFLNGLIRYLVGKRTAVKMPSES